MPAATPPPVDEYERKYMGGSAVIARSRIANPWWMSAMLAGLTLFLLSTGVATFPQGIVPLALTPLFATLWVLLLFMRVSVTDTHVHIQYGPFGPKLPIETIRASRVETYDPLNYGGWGIRLGPEGWAYSVPGHARGIRVTYEVNGRVKNLFASSDRPEELVAAIEKARTRVTRRVASTSARPGPRLGEQGLAERETEEREPDRRRSAS